MREKVGNGETVGEFARAGLCRVPRDSECVTPITPVWFSCHKRLKGNGS